MRNITEVIRENQGPSVNIEAIIRGLGIELDKGLTSTRRYLARLNYCLAKSTN